VVELPGTQQSAVELPASSLSAASLSARRGLGAAAVERRFRSLVFADEFTGPPGGRPDPARWTVESGSRGKGQLQYYTPDRNAYLDGRGPLVIETRRELTPGVVCPTPEPATRDNGTGTCRYTSARLSTRATARFTYGRFVARIRVPAGSGLVTAFWLSGLPPSGATGPWPTCREIDMMEYVGRMPRRVFASVHGPSYCGPGVSSFLDLAEPVPAAFRTYAMTWTPRSLVFSVDGVVFHVVRRADVQAHYGRWVYDDPYYMIINTSVGGDWPGQPSATLGFPRRTIVDFVRVYQ
jgi:beta-glucanase (GH16 family)